MALPLLPTCRFHSKFISKVPFRQNHSLDKHTEWNKFGGFLFWGQRSIFSSYSSCILTETEKHNSQTIDSHERGRREDKLLQLFNLNGDTEKKLLSKRSHLYNDTRIPEALFTRAQVSDTLEKWERTHGERTYPQASSRCIVSRIKRREPYFRLGCILVRRRACPGHWVFPVSHPILTPSPYSPLPPFIPASYRQTPDQ